MTPEQALRKLSDDGPQLVYLLLGEEAHRRDAILTALKSRLLQGGFADLNYNEFTSAEAEVGDVLASARMVPMLSPHRLVVLRDLDRWEGRNERSATSDKTPLDLLASYCEAPVPSCTLVLMAGKLNGRRRLVTLAKKLGFVVDCAPLSKQDIPRWIEAAVAKRGQKISPSAAALLAEVKGPELAPLDDAVERLCLYADGSEITEATLEAVMPVVRPATVWELLDALLQQDVTHALVLLSKVYEPKDRGLPLLGLVTWSVRQLAKFQAARREGKRPEEAGREAGVPPFRVQSLERTQQRLNPALLERWLRILRDTDHALKGGSRLPALQILETTLIELCREGAAN